MKTLPAATRLAAFLSGVALSVGMSSVHALQSAMAMSQQAEKISELFALLLLLFCPVMIFVVGITHLSIRSHALQKSAYRASLAQVALRFLFWLGGCGLGITAPATFAKLTSP